MHWKPESRLVQEPPFKHEFSLHVDTGVSQLGPWKPFGQMHIEELDVWAQVPPFAHGVLWQSCSGTSQLVPVYSAGQLQV